MALHRPALFLLPLLLAASSAESFFFFPVPWFFSNPFLPKTPNEPAEAEYPGSWELVSNNAGVSAMHLILTPSNKVIMYDTFIYGTSQINLPDGVPCLPLPKGEDCSAHAVEYDIITNNVRPLKLTTDTWCSAGGLDADGTLVSTGGWMNGIESVRYLEPCPTCDWKEYANTLVAGGRWYSSQQILPDGRFVSIGGRGSFSYEYVPEPGKKNIKPIDLPFLSETTDKDENKDENNLYPFVHLVPDGNLFIFANNRAILLNPKSGKVVVDYPHLPGGSRNYPASGMSALLPIDLRTAGGKTPAVEVLVCGGAPSEGKAEAGKGNFLPALNTCGRMVVNSANPNWEMEEMPIERVMADMLVLPNGEVLMINGARKGVSGWWLARDPVLEPVLYTPAAKAGRRFRTLAATEIPRVYHSSCAVLPDASVLVAGSNTNNGYNFTDALFPTELRVEKFYPPYLDEAVAGRQPEINEKSVKKVVRYRKGFSIEFTVEEELKLEEVMVTMMVPPFTTHGHSQGQRLIILKTKEFTAGGGSGGAYRIKVAAPKSAAVAPPGYYMVFVVNGGVPSNGVWVKIQWYL